MNLIDIHRPIQMIQGVLLLKHRLLVLSFHHRVTARVWLTIIANQIRIEFQLPWIHTHRGAIAGPHILRSN